MQSQLTWLRGEEKQRARFPEDADQNNPDGTSAMYEKSMDREERKNAHYSFTLSPFKLNMI